MLLCIKEVHNSTLLWNYDTFDVVLLMVFQFLLDFLFAHHVSRFTVWYIGRNGIPKVLKFTI